MDEDRWIPVARLGGWAAVAMLVLIPLQLVAYVLVPPPTTVTAWFELFERHRLLALIDLDLLLLVDELLAGLVFAGLWVALRRSHPVAAAVMLVLELVAIAAYIPSNPAFDLMSLAAQHADAPTAARREQLRAAGDAVLAAWTGTAFVTSYLLSASATIVASIAMLRARGFGRAVGTIGLVYGALNLVPANAGTVGLVLSLASLLPMIAWLASIARVLLRRTPAGNPARATGGLAPEVRG